METKKIERQITRLTVNGIDYELLVSPNTTLLELLRDQLDLTGTKIGCGAGECGACTVLVDAKPVLACLTLALAVKGKSIVTIEGLARGNTLHPVQKAFVEYGAIQCGYCTPGMVLAAKAFLEENPAPTRQEVRRGLAGNLCRCTGYVKIVDAVMAAAAEMKAGRTEQ